MKERRKGAIIFCKEAGKGTSVDGPLFFEQAAAYSKTTPARISRLFFIAYFLNLTSIVPATLQRQQQQMINYTGKNRRLERCDGDYRGGCP